MPITPLHLGLLAPINHFAPNKVSNVSFILANIWMDADAIRSVLMDAPFPSHSSHTFVVASAMFIVVAGLGMRSQRWMWGAFLGAYSHILLDGMVHMDMEPFEPFTEGNPLYLGLLQPLSWVLIPFTAWWVIQMVRGFTVRCASGSLGSIGKRLAALLQGRLKAPSV